MDTFYLTFTRNGKSYEAAGTIRDGSDPVQAAMSGDLVLRERAPEPVPVRAIPRKKPREGVLPEAALSYLNIT
jgi:hypothetical protein